MKKSLFKIFALFTLLFISSCSQISNDIEKEIEVSSGKTKLFISLKQSAERTISPANGISFADVKEWTLSITETSEYGYTPIIEKINFHENPTFSCEIPIGSFDIVLEGNVETDDGNSIPYYGKNSLKITGEETEAVPVSISVAPKNKSTGSFEYTLNFTEDSSPIKKLTARLNDKILDVIHEENSQSWILKSPEDGIPSGLYDLYIEVDYNKYEELEQTETKEIFNKYFDSLVEIIDDCKTSGTKTITFSKEDTKIYYTTVKKEKATGNGVFKEMPAFYEDIISKEITVPDIKIIVSDLEKNEDGTFAEYPLIDVANLQTYTVYSIYFDSLSEDSLAYSLGKSSLSECYINLIKSNKLNLIDSVNDSITTIYPTDSIVPIYLTLNGGTSACLPSDFNNDLFFTFTEEIFNIYKEKPLIITDFNYSGNIEIFGDASDIIILGKYAESNKDLKEYYFTLAKQTDISMTQNIPNFDIIIMKNGEDVTGSQINVCDEITLKLNPTDGEFKVGTSFEWYLNSKLQTPNEDGSLTITIGKGDTDVINNCLCIATFGDEQKSKSYCIEIIESIQNQ